MWNRLKSGPEADSKVVFLHKIVPGGADKSYGIHVAQLAGLPSPVVQRANEIMAELEKTSGRAVRIDLHAAQQAALFPETSPLLDELGRLAVNSLSPIEALNKLFEWQKKFSKKIKGSLCRKNFFRVKCSEKHKYYQYPDKLFRFHEQTKTNIGNQSIHHK